jgi:DHA2 family multidrug resistance protein
MTVICALALVSAVVWELRHPQPMINLRLLKDRNFLFCSIVVYCAWAVLYGSTVLLPQLLQALMGYSATEAGLALSPAGIFTMIQMPIVGWLLGRRVDARWCIVIGLCLMATGTFWMSNYNLQVSHFQIIWPRVVQSLGTGFLFVPINTAAYLTIPRDQFTNATGLFNLIRNQGSSAGVAFVTTMLARRTQFHQLRLTDSINPLSQTFNDTWVNLTQITRQAVGDPVYSQQQALGRIYLTVQAQAQALAYYDLYWLFTVMALSIIPLVFLMRRSVAEGGAVAVH